MHNSGGDGGFDVYIGRLRKALNDDEAPTFWRPVRSAGYASIVAHIWIAFGHEDLVDHDDSRRDPTTIPGAQPRQSVVDREGQVM